MRQSLRTREKSDVGVSSYLQLYLKQGRMNTNGDSMWDKSPAQHTVQRDSLGMWTLRYEWGSDSSTDHTAV